MEQHVPVLVDEVLALLECRTDRLYVDGTVGSGGHARAILEASSPSGMLVGIDRDEEALALAHETLRPYGSRVILRQGSFSAVEEILADEHIDHADGMLCDLGMSREQLASQRGFSYQIEGPLDMRLDRTCALTARELIARAPAAELEGVIRRFGEERFARRIARAIRQQSREGRISTTRDLSDAVRRAVPYPGRLDRTLARVFQAFRIAVNDELEELRRGLCAAVRCLRPPGHICVISYHSLEDRVVKHFFRGEPSLAVLTPKPVRPLAAEAQRNPRSRSARLRAAARTDPRVAP
jgi:16S rRNA (cytosine1402-N4)-methyltransferase